jgi:hypothetical protein
MDSNIFYVFLQQKKRVQGLFDAFLQQGFITFQIKIGFRNVELNPIKTNAKQIHKIS